MTYLGIGLLTDCVIHVVLEKKDNIIVKDWARYVIREETPEAQSYEVYSWIKKVIEKNAVVDVVVSKWVDFAHTNKFKGLDIVRLKERILIACGEYKALHVEPDTYGWERYLMEKASTKNKTDLVKHIFNIDFENDHFTFTDEERKCLADTFIMTTGIALGYINAKNRQIIDYNFKLVDRKEG